MNAFIGKHGNGPTGITSKSGFLDDDRSNQIDLVNSSAHIKVTNYDRKELLYISLAGPATADDYAIQPGDTFLYDGPPLVSVMLLGDAKNHHYGIFAV